MGEIGRQEPLPAMPEPSAGRPDMDRGNAFARAVTLGYWGIDPTAYEDIDQRMMALVSPDRLRPSLIDVPFDPERSPSALSYFDPSVHHRHNIALTPQEFGVVNRGVEYLARHAVNRTLASRGPREDFTVDQAAAQRAGVHVTERRQKGMETYVDETLLPRLHLLDRFIEAAQHPGFRRMKELDMRMSLGVVRDQIFNDMFIALRQQRSWTPDQEQLARRALDKRLFVERRSNEHIMHWRNMLRFNREYTGHKAALFNDRIADSKRYTRQHA